MEYELTEDEKKKGEDLIEPEPLYNPEVGTGPE